MSSSCIFGITEMLTRLCCLWYLRQKGTDVQAARTQTRGPTGNGKGALISLFVMLQRIPPPCVFFWISLVHPSPTSLPFSAHNSRFRNGTVQCSSDGWATINEWLFSIHCSHCGCYNWLHLWNHTMRCYSSVTGGGSTKGRLVRKDWF